MPLLFGKNNFPVQEAANIKAPPFPDQQQTVGNTASDASSVTVVNAIDSVSNPTPHRADASSEIAQQATAVAPQVVKSVQVDTGSSTTSSSEEKNVVVTPEIAKKVQDDAAAAAADAASAAANPPDAANSNPAPQSTIGKVVYEPAPDSINNAAPAINPAPIASQLPADQPSVVKADNLASQPAVAPALINKDLTRSVVTKNRVVAMKVKKVYAKQVKTFHAQNAIAHSGKTGWVIQLGNFAVKHNATHMTNVLQAAGYKAFTRDIQTANGKRFTRVYVGPEFAQASAVRVSKELNNKLSFQGFVVPYAKAVS